MAIQLNPQVQQQRQAPFAAFDTTSQFKSGGEAIGRALSQVSSAAMQISATQKQRALQAQNLLASEALNTYDVELDRVYGEYEAAIASGQTGKIEEARNNFNNLQKPDFNSYLSGTEGGTITNTDVLNGISSRASVKWGKLSNAASMKESDSIVARNSINFITESNTDANLLISRYPNGQSGMEVEAFLRSNSFESEKFQNLLNGQPTLQTRDKLISAEASILKGYMTHNLETARTPEELDERKQLIDEFITGEGKGYNFDASDFLTAYNKRNKVVNNPEALVEHHKTEFSKVETLLDTFSKMTEGQLPEAERIHGLLMKNVDPRYLDKADLAKYNSSIEFLGMVLPPINEQGEFEGTTSYLDTQARLSILFKSDKRPSPEDYLTVIDPDASLDTKHRNYFAKMVNDRVDTAEQLINNGDVSGFKYLYPEFAQLMDKGDFAGAHTYYLKVVLPQMSGQLSGITSDKKVLDAFGTNMGGNIVAFPEFAINGTGEEVPLEITDVNSVVANVVKVVEQNQAVGSLAGLHNNAALFSANQPAKKTRSNVILALTSAATLNGANPQEFADGLISAIKAGQDNSDDQLVKDRTRALLDHDRSDAMGDLNASQLAQFIQIQKDTGNTVAAETLEAVLMGLVAQGKDIKGDTLFGRTKWIKSIQDFEDQYITPYAGRVYKTHSGLPVYLDAGIATENVDLFSDRSTGGAFALVGLGREKFSSIVGDAKIDGQSVANYTLASAVIRLAKGGDINMAEQFADAANFGLSEASRLALTEPKYMMTPFGGYTQKFGEETGEKTVFTSKQGDEFYKALYFGVMKNTYGDGDNPIFRLGPPVYRTEINEAGNATTKKYYTAQFWSPSSRRYVQVAYNDGKPALVPVDEVAADVRVAVKRDADVLKRTLAWTVLGNHYKEMYPIVKESLEAKFPSTPLKKITKE